MSAALVRLMTWLSPAFPVGAFSYSHGLERAVHDGLVANADDLHHWIETLLLRGSGWNDAVLLAESWRRAGDGDDLAEIANLAAALAGGAERHTESTLQGAAFLIASGSWPAPVLERLPPDSPYCVAVGAVAAAHGVAVDETVTAFLHAFASNLVQAAIRLGIIGQSAGVAVIARLEPVLLDIAARAAGSTPDDLGSATVVAEIAAMKHETQRSRLCRT